MLIFMLLAILRLVRTLAAADAGSGIVTGIGLGFLLEAVLDLVPKLLNLLGSSTPFFPHSAPAPLLPFLSLNPATTPAIAFLPTPPTFLSILSASSNILILSLTPLFNVPFVGVPGIDPLGVSLLNLDPLDVPLFEIPKS
ncbi:hypothetical protein M422DRAFT_261506 [Sphaerobolus stellatus SS14]|uniref:Uncharacterized protein n=1 Tax=Sphaerobolus stellatus (strain SS14) TaxID=990650 RepID=A0A0C9V346_SPHS4|nr:hypothetical protein M422DRAFT_261506 [Sphaerobolus stellatus SS14]